MEYTTIDEYIALFPPAIQKILNEVRKTVRNAAPLAAEKISWKMPTFYQGENLVHFAAMKNHLGLYPGAEGIAAFKKELTPYKSSKGGIQFPYTKPIPHDLIAAITAWRVRAVSTGKETRGTKKARPETGSAAEKPSRSKGKVYAALLRGLNVGGKGLVKMDKLKAAFTALGYTEVSTYIQSGNVLFRSEAEGDRAALAEKIETGLTGTLGFEIKAVVLEAGELSAAVQRKPPGFGEDAARKYDLMFVRPPLTARELLASINLKEGVDQAEAGEAAVYFSRLVARLSSSRISKITESPHYRDITIRNWNTVTKFAALAAVAATTVTAAAQDAET